MGFWNFLYTRCIPYVTVMVILFNIVFECAYDITFSISTHLCLYFGWFLFCLIYSKNSDGTYDYLSFDDIFESKNFFLKFFFIFIEYFYFYFFNIINYYKIIIIYLKKFMIYTKQMNFYHNFTWTPIFKRLSYFGVFFLKKNNFN